MLPKQYRLSHRRDFSAVVRGGERCGRRDLVVHARVRSIEPHIGDAAPEATYGGPRFGLIVSKSVGPAVTRHQVARRLRHAAAGLLDGVIPEADVVIRAKPGAATAAYAELERQLYSGLRKLGHVTSSGDQR